jgi:nicotinamidase-related amidase
MKPAIVVVDMIKDNVDTDLHLAITQEAQKIIPNINRLLAYARSRNFPIIFANDSFLPTDFIFQGRMKPHALRGTPGVEVTARIERQETDIVLEKRRFSAFFKTDLDVTLRNYAVDTIVVAGISTNVCVLLTALNGLENDFRAIILEDCCACYQKEVHEATVNIYRNFADPFLLRVMKVEDFIREDSS